MMATEKRKHKPVLNKELLDNLNQVKLPEDKSELLLKLDDLEEKTTDLNLNIITETYHKNFNNQKAITWFNAHGIKKLNRLLELKINVGFSDGSLINMISESQSIELLKLNVLNDKEEQFLNCITIPVIDEQDQVINIYGININNDKVKSLNSSHLFNQKACKVYDEVILTESIIDALSFIELDFNNVISVEQSENFKEDYIKFLKDNRVKTVIIAFKKTVSAAFSEDKIKKMLLVENIEVKEITQISCDDWNKELLAGLTREDLINIINVAEIFKPEKSNDFTVKKDGLIYSFSINDVIYRISGIKEMFVSNLKVNIKAECKDDKYFDNLDLYSARSRNSYSQNLANIFNIESKRVEKDLIKILEYLEDERDKKLNAGSKDNKEEMTEEEKTQGMEFLKSPDLFKEIINDMTTLGYVGEENNKLLIYLAGVSRLLPKPLSVFIQSPPSTGKSYLLETLQKLIPAGSVEWITSVSDQAFNYMDDEDFNGKIFMMGEALHNEVIEGYIRQMQSENKLSRRVVTKDPKTGELKSITVKHIVKLVFMMTSTAIKVNLENLSRCLVLKVDDSKEQTEMVLSMQRHKSSYDGYLEDKHVIPQIIKKHLASQRLLQRIKIFNPFQEYIKFPSTRSVMRRGQQQFLSLIDASCILRQMQKQPVEKKDKYTNEKELIYECDLVDYETARRLFIDGGLLQADDDLSSGVISLYESIRRYIKQKAKKENLKPEEVSFIQTDLRDLTNLGQSAVKQYIRILVEYEYLQVVGGKRHGTRFCYKLRQDLPIDKIDIALIIPTVEEIKNLLIKTGQKWA